MSRSSMVEMFPEQLKSVQLLDADEIRAGSLTHWKNMTLYVLMVMLCFCEFGIGSPMTAKVKIEDIEDEDLSITFNVVEGDALRFYKSFNAKLQVIKVRDDVGSAKWTSEFEKATEDAPHREHYVDFTVKMYQGLDAYLCPQYLCRP
ncbi:hypothetical protein I3843_04G045500 [Carya illinoinensis]|nr:hypothetical protein I3843_04G045500 [Carya illinoinensis]